MTYLLDTNVVSDLRRKHTSVAAWVNAHSDACTISAITIFEIELGILRVERRDPRQARTLRHWRDDHVLTEFAKPVLPISMDVARRAAALHVPDPMPLNDGYIAATALVHGLTVVTRNVADFARTGVPVVDPYG